MKKLGLWYRRLAPVAKVLYDNRKAEMALVTALIALATTVVNAAMGH